MTKTDTITDSTEILETLTGKAFKLGVSAADAILIESSDLSVSRRMGKQESLELSESKAVGLRVFKGKRQAIVSGTDLTLESLDELATRAASMADFVPEDEFASLADREFLETNIQNLDITDPTEVSAETLNTLVAEMEEAALSTKGITNSDGADGSYSRSKVTLLTSGGFSGSYEATSYSISLAVLAGSGDKMERDYDYTVSRTFGGMKKPQDVGREAARRTLSKMNSTKVKTTEVPVIFEPRVARELLSHFAGAVSGSSIARKTSFLQEMMGKQVFGSGINIIDNPHIKGGLGSKPFDGEGVKGAKRSIIENGKLTTWFLDVRSANQLGLKTTGHASRGIASPPSPSPTNLYLEAGKASQAELIADIKNGFFITETFGMGVNGVTGDYSQGAAGFWIENGNLANPVSEVTIAGNLKDMYASLIAANDLQFESRINSPSVMIPKMTVAGN